MDHYEMVENLRTKANVTYEEAKAALEASDWNMLDALVLLEGEGKVSGGAEYTAQEKKAGAKLAVELEPLRNFFPAEEYHQKYLDKNPGGYCHRCGRRSCR